MKIAIIDDDSTMTKQIEDYLQKLQKEVDTIFELEVFHDPVKFLEHNRMDYDLLLLDVEMPQMDGISLAKEIRKHNWKVLIVFITNMAQYAIHGYEVEAIDYVLKPLTFFDFSMKMKKVLRYYQRNREQKIILLSTQGSIPINVSTITYIEVIRHYLYYHTLGGIYEIRGVMRAVEEEMKVYSFAKCSQSFLVNLAHVKSIRGNDVVVNGEELPISRNRKKAFIKRL